MAATAEIQGFGARAPYAQPRASEYDMKERVRLSGLFPRVRNEPMSNQLQALMKDFEKNAALTGILERRRRLEERIQYEMKSREALAALNTNVAPQFRTGTAAFATSAAVASKLANPDAAPDAADVMTGAASPANLTRAQRRAINAAAKAKAAAAKAKAKAGQATAPASVVGVSQEGGSSGSTDGVPVFAAGVAGVQPTAKATVVKPPPPKAKANITRRNSRSQSHPRA